MKTKLKGTTLSPVFSNYCPDQLTWLKLIFDCELNVDHPVKGQILCHGTERDLKQIKRALEILSNISLSKDTNDSNFKDELFVPNNQILNKVQLLGDDKGRNLLLLLKVRIIMMRVLQILLAYE